MPFTDREGLRRDGDRASDRAAGELPVCFAVVVTSALAVVAGFGLVGLAFAVVGAFVPAVVVPLGAVAAVAFARLGRSGTRSQQASAGSAWASLAAVTVAVGFTAINIRFAGQHVLIDRDPGAYLNTGRWLASHTGLVFRADVGAFRGTRGLVYQSPAVDGQGPVMHFQFAHLLGVLLAEARWLGGDRLMFAVVPVLGGLSIVLFYAVACRFVRPLIACVATAAFAGNVVQLHFSRDAYSEIVLQVVLLGCVWLLSQPGLDPRRSAVAGVLLGMTVAARVDGPLYLAAVPILFGMALARRTSATGDDDDGSTRIVGAFGVGVAVVVVLAVVDVAWRSPNYVRSLGRRPSIEYGALVAALLVAGLLTRRAARWRPWTRTPAWFAPTIGTASAVALLVAWFVRPHVQIVSGAPIHLVAQLQRADRLASDPGRLYYENSLRWFAWYLGPPALAAAIIGIALLIRETLRNGKTYEWVLTTAFVATASVYLWNANASPDQLWVMRRFVPIVLPGFLIGAALTLEWLSRRLGRWGVIAGALLAVFMVAWPLSATAQVRDETTQANLMGALDATCRALGPRAAVVVVAGDNSFERIAPQAIRGFCDVPVAMRAPTMTTAALEDLARRLRNEGRTLVLVSDTPRRITAVAPGVHARTVADVIDPHELEQTLSKPPRHYWTKRYSFAVGEVVVHDGGGTQTSSTP